jgi:uncharacterized protein YeaO (DUF488 family)/DNA-binding MarR family transcriptional regulator
MVLPDSAYARLLALRTGLRHFERWSERQAQAAGLTPAQHQLLLAIRGHGEEPGPTVGEVADYLLLRHHSTVGLVDRAEAAGLVYRARDDSDHRVVRLYLTKLGRERLEALSELHLEELDRLALELPAAWEGLAPVQRPHGFPGSRAPGEGPRSPVPDIEVARAYGLHRNGGHYVLVDRLWPRGLARDKAPFDEWAKDSAPSTQLRQWYGHDPERFRDFARRYREELKRPPADQAAAALRARANSGRLVLVTATKDLEHSGAVVLQSFLLAK